MLSICATTKMESLDATMLKAIGNWSEIDMFNFVLNSTVDLPFDLIDVSFMLPESFQLVLDISRGMGWYVIIVSILSILFYLYSGLMLLKRAWQIHRILMSMICIDVLMLTTVCLVIFTEYYLPYQHVLSSFLCKARSFITHIAAFYINWAWFLL